MTPAMFPSKAQLHCILQQHQFRIHSWYFVVVLVFLKSTLFFLTKTIMYYCNKPGLLYSGELPNGSFSVISSERKGVTLTVIFLKGKKILKKYIYIYLDIFQLLFVFLCTARIQQQLYPYSQSLEDCTDWITKSTLLLVSWGSLTDNCIN